MAKAPVTTVGKPAVTPTVKPMAAKTVKPAYSPIGNLGAFAHPAKKKTKTK